MMPFSSHPLYTKHNIDSAMNALWEFYKRNFIVLFTVSFILSLVTSYITTFIDLNALQSMSDPQEIVLKMREYLWPALIISGISLVFYTMLHFYVIYNPLDSENSILISAVKSMRFFIPYLIIIVLMAFFGSFVLFLGVLVLIVGIFFAALYLFMIFLFILPVLMVEGPVIANAIPRTFKLAHKSFWTNLGWTAAFGVILLVISVILSGVVLLPFTGNFAKTFSDPQNAAGITELASNPLYIILSAVVSALTFPLLPIFACILYFNGMAREDNLPDKRTSADRISDDTRPGVEDLYGKPLPEEKDEIN